MKYVFTGSNRVIICIAWQGEIRFISIFFKWMSFKDSSQKAEVNAVKVEALIIFTTWNKEE